MLDNNTYNLMKQLVQEHKSLWRIKNHYLKDAEGENDCQTFWKKLEGEKENAVSELLNLLKESL